jgi:hypothetical protein
MAVPVLDPDRRRVRIREILETPNRIHGDRAATMIAPLLRRLPANKRLNPAARAFRAQSSSAFDLARVAG